MTAWLGLALMLVGSVPADTASNRAAMAQRVKAEILHSWRAYERHAWGHDELRPVTKSPHDWHGETLLMTPVDSLDTLLLAGLDEEAAKARALIVERLSFDRDVTVKNFEITIRLLGGLLSGYQMTGDDRLLRLAEDLGNRLLPVFESPTGMPYMYVNLKTGKTSGAVSNPAEIGTLLLEFGTLARLTKRPIFFEKAKRALVELDRRRSKIDLPGEEMFQYLDSAGKRQLVSSDDVNDYLREASGRDITAKDFRTWGGTVVATETLADLGPAATDRAGTSSSPAGAGGPRAARSSGRAGRPRRAGTVVARADYQGEHGAVRWITSRPTATPTPGT